MIINYIKNCISFVAGRPLFTDHEYFKEWHDYYNNDRQGNILSKNKCFKCKNCGTITVLYDYEMIYKIDHHIKNEWWMLSATVPSCKEVIMNKALE